MRFICACTFRVFSESAPYGDSFECAHIVTCDDAETTATAFQNLIQVAVLFRAGFYDASVCENHFQLLNVVSGKTALVQVRRESAAEKKTSNTNRADSTSLYAYIYRIKCPIYIDPS